MLTGRLFEIVYCLMRGGAVTAPELAARLNVSVRTIYRDIDRLSASGIPIYCESGRGGGVRLMESYTLSRSMLTDEEQRNILTALQELGAVGAVRDTALDKLAALFNKDVDRWLEIDFTDWGGGSADIFELIKQCVLGRRLLRFDYYSSVGAYTARIVEPRMLLFRHRSWYLRAFCLDRQDWRLFKLVRMRRLEALDEQFYPRAEETPAADAPPPPVFTFRLKIAPQRAYRALDEFDEHQLEPAADGGLIAEMTSTYDDWVQSFILSFGAYAEVLEPQWLRDEIRKLLQENLARY